MSNKNINPKFMMNPCINANNVSVTTDNQARLLSSPPLQEEPKISLAVAKSDEEQKLEPFTPEHRKLYLFITGSLIFQGLLNIISSIVMRSDESYCDKMIEKYPILITFSGIFILIAGFVIVWIRIFRQKTYGLMSTILFFIIESLLLGVLACYFETQYVRFINILIIIDLATTFIYFGFLVKERIPARSSGSGL